MKIVPKPPLRLSLDSIFHGIDFRISFPKNMNNFILLENFQCSLTIIQNIFQLPYGSIFWNNLLNIRGTLKLGMKKE
jgi:hypothetical protein